MSSTASTYRPSSTGVFSSNSLRQSTLKKKMSITQTYYLAHKARAKLSREAAQSDHDLRLLVGHANLLDTLMIELADAEREQERWFNQSVHQSQPKQQERHVQWADTIASVPEEAYDSDSSSESSDDEYDDDEDIEMTNAPVSLRPVPKASAAIDDDDVMEDDLEEDYAQLELVRTSSHSSPPPELVDESDSSDDESMPPSPPEEHLPEPLSKQAVKEKGDAAEQESLFKDGFYLSSNAPTSMVSTISVY
ncbi:hypothetical protein N3K66_003671 [Trichothecium roseum]|uniref:Uncharacterized protein n=1 Tax=Trichothecium roseum TaxID=47278 RepID=A0ACC0V683_9HYPO|nr:hypothetical protein N3K66_003671 [Trichothecium roseum]